MINLSPSTVRRTPYRRVMVRRRFPAGWSAWDLLGEVQAGAHTDTPGLRIGGWSRRALPQIGEATITWTAGLINGVLWPWANAPDLSNAEVRIQVSERPDLSTDGQIDDGARIWRTCWWGTVESQIDNPTQGTRSWHCYDGLYRATRWRLVRHYACVNGNNFGDCRGFPGYNISLDGWYARVLGNRDNSGDRASKPVPNETTDWWGDVPADQNRLFGFTWPGNGKPWTDRAVIEHALQAGRGKGDPIFLLRGPTNDEEGEKALALFDAGVRAWPVREGDSAWKVVAEVCDRRRGRGIVYVDWEDDTKNPTGDLDVCLRVKPQFAADLTWTPPGGTAATVKGAASLFTTVLVDLAGDQRLVAGSLVLSNRLQQRYDYVESVGECIEVLVTLSMRLAANPSLAKRWTAADETAFAAITTPRWRATSRWDPVYQRFGLPLNFRFICEDGNHTDTKPSTLVCRCDYRCQDDGSIAPFPDLESTAVPRSSPLLARILSDLPLYEGWDYSQTPPKRYDGGIDLLAPPRRPLLALARTADDRYLDLARIGFGASLDPAYGILLTYGPDQDETRGTRYFSGNAALGGVQKPDDLVLTVGLQLGERVRMASGDPSGRRRQRIEHPGLHLWLAHPGAIWDLARELSTVAEAPGRRQAAGATATPAATGSDPEPQPGSPGLLRDDRAYLAQRHALSCQWYLQDHRPASWSLRDCGFLGVFADAKGRGIAYAGLGDLVTTITAPDKMGGPLVTVSNTPVTSIEWDDAAGTTTWTTDWGDLDQQ